MKRIIKPASFMPDIASSEKCVYRELGLAAQEQE